MSFWKDFKQNLKDIIANKPQKNEFPIKWHGRYERGDGGSTAQHSTAQHSTAQHSTAQHSTAQHALL